MHSVKFVTFYSSSLECYSQAEGGCYFVYRKPVACFVLKYFTNGSSHAANIDKKLIEETADQLGLLLEGSEIQWGSNDDGSPSMRKVRGIRSAAPEADGEYFLEAEPFENETKEWPQYE
ncbi:MAG: hypothetical protein EBS86_14460 [Crocinitomicaceae bacterium]|nr:hypothetical protein [Crocinitomicaceae bacterium]